MARSAREHFWNSLSLGVIAAGIATLVICLQYLGRDVPSSNQIVWGGLWGNDSITSLPISFSWWLHIPFWGLAIFSVCLLSILFKEYDSIPIIGLIIGGIAAIIFSLLVGSVTIFVFFGFVSGAIITKSKNYHEKLVLSFGYVMALDFIFGPVAGIPTLLVLWLVTCISWLIWFFFGRKTRTESAT